MYKTVKPVILYGGLQNVVAVTFIRRLI